MVYWQAYRPPTSFADFSAGVSGPRDVGMGHFFVTTSIVVTPIATGPAFPIGLDAKDEESMANLLDTVARCLYPIPILGVPALSVPLGSQDELPLGCKLLPRDTGKTFAWMQVK